MVQWIISHIDISTCTIVNSSHQVISSFILDDVSNMHKLSPPTISLDESFLREFIKKNVENEEMKMADLIKEWWHDPNFFKIIGEKVYPIPILNKAPMLVAIVSAKSQLMASI